MAATSGDFLLEEEAVAVLKEKLLSPYIKSIDSFQVYAIADEIYDFGKISQLRKKLGQNSSF